MGDKRNSFKLKTFEMNHVVVKSPFCSFMESQGTSSMISRDLNNPFAILNYSRHFSLFHQHRLVAVAFI